MHARSIGKDEWAVELKRQGQAPPGGWRRLWQRARAAPVWVLVGGPLGLAALLALTTGSAYGPHLVGLACLLAMLAVGLTLAVGLAGLVDLGYVALFAIGAYSYALLASPQLGLHLPVWAALPAAVGAAVLGGLLIGSLALRLTSDYLAIATLGFAQVVVLLALKLDRVRLPGLAAPLDLTGGPNGILKVAAPQVLGWTVEGARAWSLVLLAALVVVTVVAGRVAHSPTGRAWQALREDPLAAAALGLPVARLRLLAVSVAGGIAGLAGGLYAGWQGAVFPVNFDLALMLTLYAAVIVGGLGSLPGAVAGAALLTALPEVLRDPWLGRALVYGAVTLLLLRRREKRIGLLLAAGAVGAGAAYGLPAGLPPEPASLLALAALAVALPAALAARRAPLRLGLQALTALLAVFVWELRLVAEPGLARPLVLGLLLIAMLLARPHGLLGRPRVEVV